MATRSPRYGIRLVALVVFTGLIALAIPFIWRAPAPWSDRTAPTFIAGTTGTARARRETRPTLDPARFVGKPALAHQVAREIPDVLDRLHCYCECDKHAGHTSLLSCYTDSHAAT